MGVCEHPQRNVQVTRARRRALKFDFSTQLLLSDHLLHHGHNWPLSCPTGWHRLHRWELNISLSLLTALKEHARTFMLPLMLPDEHHHRCPGTSHVHKTVHELQVRWKYTEFCSQMLHITLSSHQCYPLIFLPTLLSVYLLLMSEAWISDPPFSGTSHT